MIDDKINALAKLIIRLECPCGKDIIKAQKEPCACFWTPIEDWFFDNYDIDLREVSKEFGYKGYKMGHSPHEDD